MAEEGTKRAYNYRIALRSGKIRRRYKRQSANKKRGWVGQLHRPFLHNGSLDCTASFAFGSHALKTLHLGNINLLKSEDK